MSPETDRNLNRLIQLVTMILIGFLVFWGVVMLAAIFGGATRMETESSVQQGDVPTIKQEY